MQGFTYLCLFFGAINFVTCHIDKQITTLDAAQYKTDWEDNEIVKKGVTKDPNVLVNVECLVSKTITNSFTETEANKVMDNLEKKVAASATGDKYMTSWRSYRCHNKEVLKDGFYLRVFKGEYVTPQDRDKNAKIAKIYHLNDDSKARTFTEMEYGRINFIDTFYGFKYIPQLQAELDEKRDTYDLIINFYPNGTEEQLYITTGDIEYADKNENELQEVTLFGSSDNVNLECKIDDLDVKELSLPNDFYEAISNRFVVMMNSIVARDENKVIRNVANLVTKVTCNDTAGKVTQKISFIVRTVVLTSKTMWPRLPVTFIQTYVNGERKKVTDIKKATIEVKPRFKSTTMDIIHLTDLNTPDIPQEPFLKKGKSTATIECVNDPQGYNHMKIHFWRSILHFFRPNNMNYYIFKYDCKNDDLEEDITILKYLGRLRNAVAAVVYIATYKTVDDHLQRVVGTDIDKIEFKLGQVEADSYRKMEDFYNDAVQRDPEAYLISEDNNMAEPEIGSQSSEEADKQGDQGSGDGDKTGKQGEGENSNAGGTHGGNEDQHEDNN